EHEEHDHEHHDHDEHASAHSEVEVVYTFECDASSKLDSVSVAFFERWSGIEKMQVQMAGPGGQSAMTLTPAQTAIDLTKIR
ncbi:MAG TPA: DUF2796 domain-containing protein, partial [Gammaproteobacteria bacterium]|nr:DUF2796 domain-containing protein [Gammaproteobacteria bacterium]